MSEFYNPNDTGKVDLSKGNQTAYDEPSPEINIVVDNGPVFCSRCGNPIEPGDAFCSKCGTKTYGDRQAAPEPRAQQVQYGQPVQPGQYGQPGQPGQYGQPMPGGQPFPGGFGGQNMGGVQQSAYDNRTQGAQFGSAPVVNNYYYNNSNNVNNVGSGNTYNNVNMNGRVKDKYLAVALCALFGYFGIHRFYEGKIASGVLWACTGGLCGVGWIIDLLILIFKKGRYYNP